jgi:hypothetical protein
MCKFKRVENYVRELFEIRSSYSAGKSMDSLLSPNKLDPVASPSIRLKASERVLRRRDLTSDTTNTPRAVKGRFRPDLFSFSKM